MKLPITVAAMTMLALSGAAAQTTGPRWTAKVDLKLGGADEMRPAFQFNQITGMAIDPAGRIIVVDARDDVIHVYSPTGSHLYDIGRRGKGPGELQSAFFPTIDAAGQLWVYEMGNRRYSTFALANDKATFKRALAAEGGVNAMAPRPIMWNAQGQILQIGALLNSEGNRTIRMRLDTAGRRVSFDTMPPQRGGDGVLWVTVPVEGAVGGGARYSFPKVYAPHALRAFGPGGQRVDAVTDRYEIEWYDAADRLLRTLRRAATPVRVSPRERAEVDSAFTEALTRLKQPRSAISYSPPPYKPILRYLGFDHDGRLWVERHTADGQPREADLYDASGKLLATVTWPSNVEIRGWAARGDAVLGATTDSDGVISVVRLRMR